MQTDNVKYAGPGNKHGLYKSGPAEHQVHFWRALSLTNNK